MGDFVSAPDDRKIYGSHGCVRLVVTRSVPGRQNVSRRAYLGAVAAGALGPTGMVDADAVSVPIQQDGGPDPGGMGLSDWSTVVTDLVVDPNIGGPDDYVNPAREADYDDTESGEAVPLYSPRPQDLDVPEHEVRGTAQHRTAGEPYYGSPWKFFVKTGTALSLASVLYLPFVGSGYWRYTFALSGFAAAVLQNDWDTYSPRNRVGVPSEETFARWYLDRDPWIQNEGFDSHAVLLYQPARRPTEELALITAASDSGVYARADPSPSNAEGSNDSPDFGDELLNQSARTLWWEFRDTALIRGFLDQSDLRRTIASQIFNQIESRLGVSSQGTDFDAKSTWEEHFADAFTDDWDVVLWQYDDRETPVRHDRLFSVDVRPIEREPAGTGHASRWAEFRISDQYRSPIGSEHPHTPRVLASNELSVRVPKLPTPENADLYGATVEPYCHVEDQCVYVAPEVEPEVTVAAPEVPWHRYHDW